MLIIFNNYPYLIKSDRYSIADFLAEHYSGSRLLPLWLNGLLLPADKYSETFLKDGDIISFPL
ncbi:MAG: hypothetical protein HDS74_07470 [Bacteroidales bacterium]|nr:hypothetical protein [Bacteroidales bacterium]